VQKGLTPKLKPADGSGATGCKSTPLDTDGVLPTLVVACQNMSMAAFAEGMRKMPGAQQYLE
jgi:hypothetical protein